MRGWIAVMTSAIALMVAVAPASAATPIQHVVVIYMENHSFDNVLGAWCYNSGRCDGAIEGKLPDGTTIPLRRAKDLIPPMPHGTPAQITAVNGGQMNGWAKLFHCKQEDDYACMSQFTGKQFPNLWTLARQYTVSDRTFQNSPSSSWTAHAEIVAAIKGGFVGDNPFPGTAGNGPGWGCDSKRDAKWTDGTTISNQPACFPDYGLDSALYPFGGAYKATLQQPVPTIMDRLDAAALPWGIYSTRTNQGDSYFWSTCPTFAQCRYTMQRNKVVEREQVFTDAANGTLPAYSLVLPDQQNSQHNAWSMKQGDNWIGQVVGAIQNGPNWNSTAIFITYDDCGCFYDHVPPPPGLGIRTPMVIVSPWVKPRYTDSIVASYSSTLAFTEKVFGLPPLNAADANAYDYMGAFNFAQQPLAPAELQTTPLTAAEREAVRSFDHEAYREEGTDE
jgi:phospholipase C